MEKLRQFVRHPADIPIQLEMDTQVDWQSSQMQNLSFGGICCILSYPVATGTSIRIRIPFVYPAYEGRGTVVWCREHDAIYDVGVQFTDEHEAYKSRMVEQVCQIEHYRNVVRENEGRELDAEQAAMEWISRHAADFASHVDVEH